MDSRYLVFSKDELKKIMDNYGPNFFDNLKMIGKKEGNGIQKVRLNTLLSRFGNNFKREYLLKVSKMSDEEYEKELIGFKKKK